MSQSLERIKKAFRRPKKDRAWFKRLDKLLEEYRKERAPEVAQRAQVQEQTRSNGGKETG